MKVTYIAAALLATLVVFGTASCSKKEEMVQPGKQTTCPVMKGKPIDPDLHVDVNGKRIYVCCAGCIATIKADPEKYIAEMEAGGVILEEAPVNEVE